MPALEEELPVSGDGSRLLTVSQIRYCLFQEVRLDAVRPNVVEVEDVDRFNGMIEDWNSRCSRYRYRERDMLDANRTLNVKRSNLEAEGSRIAATMPSKIRSGTWLPKSPPTKPNRLQAVREALPNLRRWCLRRTSPLPPGKGRPNHPPRRFPCHPREQAHRYPPLERRRQRPPSDRGCDKSSTASFGSWLFLRNSADGIWAARRTALRDFKIATNLARDDVLDERTEWALFSQSARIATGTLTSKTDRWAPTDYPPPSGTSLNPLNKMGAARIQRRLSELGFYNGTGDGVWGQASRSSLRDFKAVNALPSDDIWDAQTEIILNSSRVARVDETVIGIWARHGAQRVTPTAESSNTLRISSSEIEKAGCSCKVLALSRSAKNWTARAECPSGTRVVGFVLSNGRLYSDDDDWRTAYVRCPKR